MLLTTFYWNESPITMYLLKTAPQSDGFNYYACFGFDILSVVQALNLIPDNEINRVRYFCEHGMEAPPSFAAQLFELFNADDIICEIGQTTALVSFDGMKNLRHLLDYETACDWHNFLCRVHIYMQDSGYRMHQQAVNRSFVVQNEDEQGNVKNSIIVPPVPARAQANLIARSLLESSFGASNRVGDVAIDKRYFQNNRHLFLSDKELAAHMLLPSAKLLHVLLSEGFLTEIVIDGKTQVNVSVKGAGYVSFEKRKRFWHKSIIALLKRVSVI